MIEPEKLSPLFSKRGDNFLFVLDYYDVPSACFYAARNSDIDFIYFGRQKLFIDLDHIMNVIKTGYLVHSDLNNHPVRAVYLLRDDDLIIIDDDPLYTYSFVWDYF